MVTDETLLKELLLFHREHRPLFLKSDWGCRNLLVGMDPLIPGLEYLPCCLGPGLGFLALVQHEGASLGSPPRVGSCQLLESAVPSELAVDC